MGVRSDTSRVAMGPYLRSAVPFLLLLVCWCCLEGLTAGEIVGRVVDAQTGNLLSARVYVESEAGEPYTVKSLAEGGTALVYDKRRGASQEVHTTLSAHPFTVTVPEGPYRIIAERGKEYRTATRDLRVSDGRIEVTLVLERWVNMAELGWYSGDTHVHRRLEELPNLVMAEDLNVALPLTYWVTEFDETPVRNSGSRIKELPKSPASLIEVDPFHVIWPINTEYEIFTVGGKNHTLGAVFVLNHQTPLDLPAQPVAVVAKEARHQDALLDLDKHNWPWSMMLMPLMEVDLYELTNNHLWRTDFLYSTWYPEYLPRYLGLKRPQDSFSEMTWIQWGFSNYYALLNCGFDIMPSAGNASGVHPVPLGFGRVYVHLGANFDFQDWMNGLEKGRSFVTTGPMLDVRFNGHLPGARFASDPGADPTISIEGGARWDQDIDRVEIIVNGDVVETIVPASAPGVKSDLSFVANIELRGTSWLAVRCFGTSQDDRPRFAHSGPVHVVIPGQPLQPKKDEIDYLIGRVNDEIERSRDILPQYALDEYGKALRFYQSKLPGVGRGQSPGKMTRPQRSAYFNETLGATND